MNYDLVKQTAHTIIGEGNLRRSAVAIALTEKDEIIPEVRFKKIAYQTGDICLPGGGLKKDETPERAAIRELMEELKISRDQIKAIAPASIFVTGSLAIHSFLCRID